MTRDRGPDFFLIGAPKAGTSALHKALVQHPGLFMSSVKEPKYYMCGDSPPPAYRGPGDAHSSQEWVWQRERYLSLFDDAPAGALRGESTPFYLYNRDARRRIAADRPDAKLIAVLRDPVDRAYSNWMHLWTDGLEPRCDVVEAIEHERWRIDEGWAPFWHYSSLGMYGRQVADLYDHVPREQVLLLRYKELIDAPGATLSKVFAFLGVPDVDIETIPSDNSRPYVQQGPRTAVLGPVIRAGAWAGQFAPPQAWRQISKPLVRQLQRHGDGGRPSLSPEQRQALLAPHREDIALLSEVTGQDFSEWLTYREGHTFASRSTSEVTTSPVTRSCAPSGRATSA